MVVFMGRASQIIDNTKPLIRAADYRARMTKREIHYLSNRSRVRSVEGTHSGSSVTPQVTFMHANYLARVSEGVETLHHAPLYSYLAL